MIWVITTIVGSFIVLTAAFKAFYSRLFVVHVRRFKILPDGPAALVALLFIEFEAGLGTALILNVFPEWVVPLTAGLVVCFSALTWWGYSYRNLEDCGCYGGFFQPGKTTGFLINAVIVCLLGVVWVNGDLEMRSDPRKIYYVIAVILVVHFIAKKTVQKPAFDLLGLKPGKPWNQSWFDIQKDPAGTDHYLFFILDRNCTLCREWIQQLSAIDPAKYQCRMVVLLSDLKWRTYQQQEVENLPLTTHRIKERVTRLLTGQLPLAVFVSEGRIVSKWSGSFPLDEINQLVKH